MEHRKMTLSNCNDWDTHSPGPWAAGEGVPSERIYSSDGHGVLVATIDPPVIEEEVAMKEADARLIAAAPDLLIALSALVNDGCRDDADCWANAAVAIAKAAGRAH